jgi:predicted DNA binding CopG/RHH family protein
MSKVGRTQEELDALNDSNLARLEEAEEALTQKEMKENFYDYDKALLEYNTKNKPITVKLSKREFEIPAEASFSFMMYYYRECVKVENGETKVNIPLMKLPAFFQSMFGDQFTQYILKQSIPFNFVYDTIVTDIMVKWGLFERSNGEAKPKESIEEKNVKSTPGSSSGVGRASKQTSKDTMG